MTRGGIFGQYDGEGIASFVGGEMPIAGDEGFEVGFETHGWGQETRMRAATAAAMDGATGSLWQWRG